MKTNKFTVCNPNGVVDSFTAPVFLDPRDIAKQLAHSIVFMEVGKDYQVYGQDCMNKAITIDGPAVVLISGNEYYRAPRLPKDDNDAYDMAKNYGPSN